MKAFQIFDAICVASVLSTCIIAPTYAGTPLPGDHHIEASGTEAGNLLIDGDLSVPGGIDFGTTSVSSMDMEAVVLSYSESGADKFIDTISTQDAATYRWQENGAASSETKMTLGAANELTLFAPNYDIAYPEVGKIEVTPSVLGSTISVDGAAVITSQTFAGTGGLFGLATADSRYVSSTDVIVGTVSTTSYPYSGPTLALKDGSATAIYALAGFGSTASSDYALALGTFARASGNAASAIGFDSHAQGNNSTAIGYFSIASGQSAHALGVNTNASGSYSTAIGESANASGDGSIALGGASNASGGVSVAIGYLSTASGIGATSLGFESVASGEFSVAAGLNTTAAGHSQFVVGRYNVLQGDAANWLATDDLFVVGNGTSASARSNALVVKKNGNTLISGELSVAQKAEFAGDVVVTGRIRIAPQGDLAMGDFTSEPTP